MRPLKYYRVLDFGTAWAGPMAGHILGDLGAEVIKVESRTRLDGHRMGRPIVGDDVAGGDRGEWPDLQPAFHDLNRNKLSITVNLKHPKGADLIRDLAKRSDVVLDNSSPGVMGRLGLDYEALRKVKPDIITVSMPGAGSYGPYSNIVSYAHTILSLSGLASMLGYRGERFLGNMHIPWGDTIGAMHTAMATLVALRHRNVSGQGQHIETAQWEGLTSFLGEAIMDYTMNQRVYGPQGNFDPEMAPHGNYPCKDRDTWVSIAIKTPDEWRSFCKASGDPAWTKEKRFADAFSRMEYRDELDKLVSQWTMAHTPSEVTELLQKVGVAAAPVMNIENQYFDEHFRQRQTFIELEHPKVGIENLHGIPWKLGGTPGEIHRCAPNLGEHNGYVFGDILGLSKNDIAGLLSEGAIE